jgi:hypothetical protein
VVSIVCFPLRFPALLNGLKIVIHGYLPVPRKGTPRIPA